MPDTSSSYFLLVHFLLTGPNTLLPLDMKTSCSLHLCEQTMCDANFSSDDDVATDEDWRAEGT